MKTRPDQRGKLWCAPAGVSFLGQTAILPFDIIILPRLVSVPPTSGRRLYGTALSRRPQSTLGLQLFGRGVAGSGTIRFPGSASQARSGTALARFRAIHCRVGMPQQGVPGGPIAGIH